MKRSEPNPREALGLTAAYEGDVRALMRFASFVKNEFDILAMSDLPEEIKVRLCGLSGEIGRFDCFLEGYASAESAAALRRAKDALSDARFAS